MADTSRSISDVITLLADNSAGNISEQDLRDLVKTLQVDHAQAYLASSYLITVADTDTWYPVESGDIALSSGAANFSLASNALQYDGAVARKLCCHGAISFSTAANNQVCEVRAKVGGVALTPSVVQRKTGTGGDVGFCASAGHATVNPGDAVTIEVRNTTSASNITVLYYNLIVTAHAI